MKDAELYRVNTAVRTLQINSGLSKKGLVDLTGLAEKTITKLLNGQRAELTPEKIEKLNEACKGYGADFLKEPDLISQLALTRVSYVVGEYSRNGRGRLSTFDTTALTELQSAVSARGGRNGFDICDKVDESSRHHHVIVGSPRSNPEAEQWLSRLFGVEADTPPRSQKDLTLPFYFFWPDKSEIQTNRSTFQVPQGLLPPLKEGKLQPEDYAFLHSDEQGSGKYAIRRTERNSTGRSRHYGVGVVGRLRESGTILTVLCGQSAPATVGVARTLINSPSLPVPTSNALTLFAVEVIVTHSHRPNAADPREIRDVRLMWHRPMCMLEYIRD